MGDITINNYGPKVLVWRSKKARDSEDTWTRERDVVINGVP